SFDHLVTQWISVVMASVGSSRNAFQFHCRTAFLRSSIVNSHCSSGTRGVEPAERTGKSSVRYCPGGSLTSAAPRRPTKPRDSVIAPYLISQLHTPRPRAVRPQAPNDPRPNDPIAHRRDDMTTRRRLIDTRSRYTAEGD